MSCSIILYFCFREKDKYNYGMSTINDFNKIDDCDKIDPLCIDAFSDLTLDEDGALCSITSWGESCIDLAQAVKDFESCTTLYLSPEDNPNCLVYEPEDKCGDNVCIHGDDLSRIISMTKLKDVDQGQSIGGGNVYMYNSVTSKFEPYDLATFVANTNAAITNINAAIANLSGRVSTLETTVADHGNRLTTIEAAIAPPEGTPSNARIVHGVINIYGDHNAVVDASGDATSLDKTHGLYSHSLNISVDDDQIMG